MSSKCVQLSYNSTMYPQIDIIRISSPLGAALSIILLFFRRINCSKSSTSQWECRSLLFGRYSFLGELCHPHRSLPGVRSERNFQPEPRLAWIQPVSNWPACEIDVFLCGSIARQKKVSTWILKFIRFKSSLIFYFRGVPFFGTFMNTFVLFQFSRWGMYTCFALNTCANKDIHLHQF